MLFSINIFGCSENDSDEVCKGPTMEMPCTKNIDLFVVDGEHIQ